MAYNLIITERTDELIDSSIYYIINKLNNPQAAKHLLDGISKLYDRLEDNPYQFPDSMDEFLKRRGYKEALVSDMQYKLIFRIEDNAVYIVGLFHDLEDYVSKVIEQCILPRLILRRISYHVEMRSFTEPFYREIGLEPFYLA